MRRATMKGLIERQQARVERCRQVLAKADARVMVAEVALNKARTEAEWAAGHLSMDEAVLADIIADLKAAAT